MGGWGGSLLHVSLSLSVCWLEKLVLIHGALVLDFVMYTMYDRNKYCGCCY